MYLSHTVSSLLLLYLAELVLDRNTSLDRSVVSIITRIYLPMNLEVLGFTIDIV